jgi:hypothetical protein
MAIFSRCDGKRDCPGDGEDELDCMSSTCSDNQFTCKSGQCISIGKKCNGDKDCVDGSDELDCHPQECDKGKFSVSVTYKSVHLGANKILGTIGVTQNISISKCLGKSSSHQFVLLDRRDRCLLSLILNM